MIEAVLTDGEFDLLRRLIHAHAGIAIITRPPHIFSTLSVSSQRREPIAGA